MEIEHNTVIKILTQDLVRDNKFKYHRVKVPINKIEMRNFKITTGIATVLSALLITCFLTSCGYYKEEEIRMNAGDGKGEYVIWVWHNVDLIESYRIPLESATCEKVDSLNARADCLLVRIKKLENYR